MAKAKEPMSDEPDAVDPFGDSSAALNSPRPKQAGFGKLTGRGNGRSGKDKRDHLARVIERLHTGDVPAEVKPYAGGLYWVCDRRETTFTGKVVSIDMLGFMDIQGIFGAGWWFAVNVTSQGSIEQHLREYTDPTNTYSQAKTPVIHLLRLYLNNGGIFYIAGYYRKGRYWHYEWRRVTHELLDGYESRKRTH
jgi:hypothetical protein